PHWVRPELVAQIKFTEWTADAKLRHPVYLGLRDDKKPTDVRREEKPSAQEPGSRVLSSKVPGSKVLGSKVRGSKVPVPKGRGSAVHGSGTRSPRTETLGTETLIDL